MGEFLGVDYARLTLLSGVWIILSAMNQTKNLDRHIALHCGSCSLEAHWHLQETSHVCKTTVYTFSTDTEPRAKFTSARSRRRNRRKE